MSISNINNEIIESTEKVLINLERKLTTDILQYWNEHVFRYELTKELLSRKVHVENEWKRIDLIAHDDTNQTVIAELKFYRAAPTINKKSKRIGWKGTASDQNFRETVNSYNILFNERNGTVATSWGADINHALLILVYIDGNKDGLTFDNLYKGLDKKKARNLYGETIFSYKKSIGDLTLYCHIVDIKKEIPTNLTRL